MLLQSKFERRRNSEFIPLAHERFRSNLPTMLQKCVSGSPDLNNGSNELFVFRWINLSRPSCRRSDNSYTAVTACAPHNEPRSDPARSLTNALPPGPGDICDFIGK